MEVRVTLGPEDFGALYAHLQTRPSTSILPLIILLLLFLLLFSPAFMFAIVPEQDYVALIAALLGVLPGVLLGAGLMWLLKREFVPEWDLFRQRIADYGNVPMRVDISPQGVAVEVPRFSALYRWVYFPEITLTRNHVFLFTAKYEAIIVPRRAFSTDQAFIDFGELCKRYFDLAERATPSDALAHPQGIKTRADEFTHGLPNR